MNYLVLYKYRFQKHRETKKRALITTKESVPLRLLFWLSKINFQNIFVTGSFSNRKYLKVRFQKVKSLRKHSENSNLVNNWSVLEG